MEWCPPDCMEDGQGEHLRRVASLLPSLPVQSPVTLSSTSRDDNLPA